MKATRIPAFYFFLFPIGNVICLANVPVPNLADVACDPNIGALTFSAVQLPGSILNRHTADLLGGPCESSQPVVADHFRVRPLENHAITAFAMVSKTLQSPSFLAQQSLFPVGIINVSRAS